nr:MAG TPA: hypothetical protein [Caudoviricetes sp.]
MGNGGVEPPIMLPRIPHQEVNPIWTDRYLKSRIKR